MSTYIYNTTLYLSTFILSIYSLLTKHNLELNRTLKIYLKKVLQNIHILHHGKTTILLICHNSCV